MKKINRKLSFILSVVMMLQGLCINNICAETINDYSNHWAAKTIENLINESIITGYDDGSIKPDNEITRAEFVTLTNRLFDYEEKALSNFTDVSHDAWYADQFLIAKAAGYFSGDNEGYANPTNYITRAEVCTIMSQALGLEIVDETDFTDDSLIPIWAKGFIGAMSEVGLINGYPNGSFAANKNITRAEAFVIINNVINWNSEIKSSDNMGRSNEADNQVPMSEETESSETTTAAVRRSRSGGGSGNAGSNNNSEAVILSIDTSEFNPMILMDGYAVKGKIDGIKGTLTNSNKVSSMDYIIYNDNDDIIASGNIEAAASWKITDVGLFYGKNRVVVTAHESETVIYQDEISLYNYSEENFENLSLDEEDDDNDGLLNYIEDYYNTNRNLADTDGDGLNDYYEIFVTNTDPLLKDTDFNGISDADEDLDNDGLTNIEEFYFNSDPLLPDTDFDGLADGEEVIYNTLADDEDTDGDGIKDKDEILFGLDPLSTMSDGVTPDSERTFKQILAEENISKELIESNAVPELEVSSNENLNFNSAINTAINENLNNEKSVVGKAIEISSDIYLKDAEAKLSFDVSDANASEYIICQYKDGEYIPLETASEGENILSTTIFENGIYFVMDVDVFLKNLGIDLSAYKTLLNTVDRIDISGNNADNSLFARIVTMEQDNSSVLSIKDDTVSDSAVEIYNAYENADDGYLIYLSDSYMPVRLMEKPTAGSNADTDGDGISDVDELKSLTPEKRYLGDFIKEIADGFGITWEEYINAGGPEYIEVYDFYSNPALIDTDYDGIPDNKDKNPREWEVSARTLATFAALAYDDPYTYNSRTVDNYKRFHVYGSADEVYSNWTLVNNSGNISTFVDTHFNATTFKNGNNVVIAFRGTDGEIGEWLNNIFGVGLLNYHTEESYALNYAVRIAERYPDCKLYITGHSLGGYLAQFGTYGILKNASGADLEKVYYFDGIGLKYNKLLFFSKSDEIETLKSYSDNKRNDKLISYYINGDVVSALGTHSGREVGFDAPQSVIDRFITPSSGGFFGSISDALINGFSYFGSLTLAALSNTNAAYYYDKYGARTILEYLHITHEIMGIFNYLEPDENSLI